VPPKLLQQILTVWIAEGEKIGSIAPADCGKNLTDKRRRKKQLIFANKGIRTNCTLIFSPGQALPAAKKQERL